MASILRFDNWQNSDGTSIATTDASGNISFAGSGAGKILQVVSTAKTDTWSGSVTAEAFSSNITGLEVTITPTSATSKVLIICLLHASHGNYGQANWRLVRNGTAVGVADAASSRPQLTSGLQPSDVTSATATPQMNMGAHYLDSPASTSALTYGVQLYNVNPTGTFYVNRTQNDGDSTSRGRWVSTITAMEVSA